EITQAIHWKVDIAVRRCYTKATGPVPRGSEIADLGSGADYPAIDQSFKTPAGLDRGLRRAAGSRRTGSDKGIAVRGLSHRPGRRDEEQPRCRQKTHTFIMKDAHAGNPLESKIGGADL